MLQPLFLSAFSDVLRTAFSPETPHFYLIWGFAVGFFLAILANYVNRRLIGRLPRKLAQAKAHSPETACSLEQIDCGNFLYRFCLRKGSMLRKLIRRQGENSSDIALCNNKKSNIVQQSSCDQSAPAETEQAVASAQATAQDEQNASPSATQIEGAKEPSLPRATDCFYIPEANQYRLERTYSASRYMELQVLLSAPVLAALAVFVFWVLPKFL